jgi:hypothetical protein
LPLVEQVDGELRIDIELFSRGGLAVLDAIESIGYNTLQIRPALSGRAKLRLLGLTYAKRNRIGSFLRALSQSRLGRSA